MLQSFLLDEFDNPAGTRFDQNCAAIYNRVPIFPGAAFRRHVVIGDAFFRQNRANSDVLAILIGRASLPDNISATAGTLTDAEGSSCPPAPGANDPADDGTDGTGCSFATP